MKGMIVRMTGFRMSATIHYLTPQRTALHYATLWTIQARQEGEIDHYY